ncbi:MAG: hypothetical protein HXX20_09595 [Chloroflexi bacterium]|nr:hypothetical protein [Chloroflexota bacterium]
MTNATATVETTEADGTNTSTSTAEVTDTITKEDFIAYQGKASVYKIPKPPVIEPQITIHPTYGKISLNGPVLEVLGHPKAVILSFNPKAGLISIHAASVEDPYVFPVPEKPETALVVRISAGRFLKAIKYPYDQSLKGEPAIFTPTFKHGRILIDVSSVLKEAGNENNSNEGAEEEEDHLDKEEEQE